MDFKGNENPHIKVKGELGNSVHISGVNNVSIDIDSQERRTDLNVDCAGTLRLENKTGNSPLELKLTYKQAEGAGYTVVLDGEELEETPAYENAAVSLNESLTIIPNISDPIPDDSSAGGDSSDAAGGSCGSSCCGCCCLWRLHHHHGTDAAGSSARGRGDPPKIRPSWQNWSGRRRAFRNRKMLLPLPI